MPMRLRRRPGIEPAVLILATLVLTLVAVGLLMFVTQTGLIEAGGYLQQTEAQVGAEMDEQADGIRAMIEQRLRDGIGADIISGDPC